MSKITDEELAGAAYAQAGLARNDPDYGRSVQEIATDARKIANNVSTITVVTGRDPHVQVRTAKKDNGVTRETAQAMGRLFEAPVFMNATPQVGDSGPITQRQPAKHTFYRDDRRGK